MMHNLTAGIGVINLPVKTTPTQQRNRLQVAVTFDTGGNPRSPAVH